MAFLGSRPLLLVIVCYSSFIRSLGATSSTSANFLRVEALAPLFRCSKSLKVACDIPVLRSMSCWLSARSLRSFLSFAPSTSMNLLSISIIIT